MTKPLPPLRAVLFDAYGTLFDVHSVALRADALFAGYGMRLSQIWRDKQVEYSRLVTTCNDGAHYQPFWALTEAALSYAIDAILLVAEKSMNTMTSGQFDLKNASARDFKASAMAQLMNEYRHLSAYPENRAVLQGLKDRGLKTGILSNGDAQMLDIAVRSAGLADVLDHVISVDTVRRYKTHPAAYALGPQTLGLKVNEIGFVSSNSWDALAATWYGYRTLWVNRGGMPFDTLGTPPTHIGQSLTDIAQFFGETA